MKRIQRQRTKGWQMPANAIYVGRPSPWGNPFLPSSEFVQQAVLLAGYPLTEAWKRGMAVSLYRSWLDGGPVISADFDSLDVEFVEGNVGGSAWLRGTIRPQRIDLPRRPDLSPLRGHDLACWCPTTSGFLDGSVSAAVWLLTPCHADVLVEQTDGRAMKYWHGGGRIDGDLVLPGIETGISRSGDVGVHVTTDRSLAETYASTVDGSAWVYEVVPIGELVPVPSLVGGPTISYRCAWAKIVRRFTLSNADRARYRAAVMGTGLLAALTEGAGA